MLTYFRSNPPDGTDEQSESPHLKNKINNIIKNSLFKLILILILIINPRLREFVGLGGLGVPCSPQDLWFAASNSAKFDGFFRT